MKSWQEKWHRRPLMFEYRMMGCKQPHPGGCAGFRVARWVLGRDEEWWNIGSHPTSHAWSSCLEDGGERFQTLIPFCTSPLIFSSSAFPQEDELKLTGRDKGSEVRKCLLRCIASLQSCFYGHFGAAPGSAAEDASPRPVT